MELFFQSSCTILHVFHQCMRISLALHPHQHLNIDSLLNFIQFSGYLLLSHCSLVGISLMINGAEHLFFFSFIVGSFILLFQRYLLKYGLYHVLFFFIIFYIYFFIEGWLLYRILLLSVKPQHESAIGLHVSTPFWTSLLSPTPSHPSRLIQKPCLNFLIQTANSIVYLFYIW